MSTESIPVYDGRIIGTHGPEDGLEGRIITAPGRKRGEVHSTTQDRLFLHDVLVSGGKFHGNVSSEADMLALNTETALVASDGTTIVGCHAGDWAYRTDTSTMWRCMSANGEDLADWFEFSAGGGGGGGGVWGAITGTLSSQTDLAAALAALVPTSRQVNGHALSSNITLKADDVFGHGADIASAGTIDLDSATADLIDVTGTTAITAITLSDGRIRFVRFAGALTLTHGASLVLPTAANITTAAEDFAIFRGYAAGVVRCIVYSKADGKPLALPIATNTVLGAVKKGERVSVDAVTGELSADLATAGTAGAVKPGTGLAVDGDGKLDVQKASVSALGGVKVGAGLDIDGDGVLSVVISIVGVLIGLNWMSTDDFETYSNGSTAINQGVSWPTGGATSGDQWYGALFPRDDFETYSNGSTTIDGGTGFGAAATSGSL